MISLFSSVVESFPPRPLAFKKVVHWIWQTVPFREVIICCALLLAFKEEYPLSHFPMYAGLSTTADVARLTDFNGNLLYFKPTFGIDTASARKMLRTRERGLKATIENEQTRLHTAGVEVIESLLNRLSPNDRSALVAKGLILYREELRLTNGKIVPTPLAPVRYPEANQ